MLTHQPRRHHRLRLPGAALAAACALAAYLALPNHHSPGDPLPAKDAAWSNDVKPSKAGAFRSTQAAGDWANKADVMPQVQAVFATLATICTNTKSEWQQLRGITEWVSHASEEELQWALVVGPNAATGSKCSDLLQAAIAGRLGEMDGRNAVAIMNSLPQGREMSAEAKRELFLSWFAVDPQGAIEGATAQLQLEGGKKFSPVLGALLLQANKTSPALALATATALANSDQPEIRQLGFEAHASSMPGLDGGSNNYGQAMKWIETVKVSGEERRFLLTELVQSALRSKEPDAAMQVFQTMAPDPETKLGSFIVEALAEKQPQQAEALVLSLPAGEARADAANILVATLAGNDQASVAVAWLANQGARDDFNLALRTLASSLEDSDPQGAWRSAVMLTDSFAAKEPLAYQYGMNWLHRDFDKAVREVPESIIRAYILTQTAQQQIQDVFPMGQTSWTVSWHPKGK